VTANYSNKSLVEKLGIKQGSRMIILHSPRNYNNTLGKLPEKVVVVKELRGPLDFIHFFTKKRRELEDAFPILKRELSRDGMIWISWPRGRSGIRTDLSEGMVREVGLSNQLVDVKVCAVDETWSGLKFVRRVRRRRNSHE